MHLSYQYKLLFSIIFVLLGWPMQSLAETATLIRFVDHERGLGDIITTMTINQHYMRIDDNINQKADQQEGQQEQNKTGLNKDFVLYDRVKKTIYSVSSEEQHIVKVKQQAITIKPSIALTFKVKALPEDRKAPLINEKKSQNFQIMVNNKLCAQLVSVPGLMPDVVLAMQQFSRTLAGQQAQTLSYIPGDLHEACDLARHTFYPDGHLQKGFPVIVPEIGKSGVVTDVLRSRILINFKTIEVTADHFKLPDYPVVNIN